MPRISEMATGRSLWLDEFDELLDTFEGSDRHKRNLAKTRDAYQQKWKERMRESYESVASRASSEAEAANRILAEGERTVEEIMEDQGNGEITAREAGAMIAAARGT